MTYQLLEAKGIGKSFGAHVVLDGVSLSLNVGERCALIGENGAGKTTLARILVGEVQPDAGEVRLPTRAEIGYLPQDADLEEEITLQRFMERAAGGLDRAAERMHALEAHMAAGLPEGELASALDEYGRLQERLERQGWYEIDVRLDRVLEGLGLAHLDRRRRHLHTLSGGEKRRAMLAGLLVRSPELLVLDEPTNHLDLSALEWLEDYLAAYRGALLVISHDRHFLNRVANVMLELSPIDHKLTAYYGGYDTYLREKEKVAEKEAQVYEAQQEEIKQLRRLIKGKTHSSRSGRAPTDGDKIAYDFHGERATRGVERTIHAARRRLWELQRDAIPRPTRRWEINPAFDPAELGSRQVIRLEGVSKSYGATRLLQDVSETIQGGERIVLMGPNGCGKSTLLKIILGLVPADGGRVRIASGAVLGYLDQEQETLDLGCTVLEEYSAGAVGLEAELRADLHRYGLFGEAQVHQRIGDLSIGQRRKLQIARLIASRANILILDEPTNHIDLASLEQFEGALRRFPGTMLAVSHDRWFIERVATRVWELRDGTLHARPAGAPWAPWAGCTGGPHDA